MIQELNGIKGYRESYIEEMLTEKAYEDFNIYMIGKTVAIDEEGESFIYYYDFEDWLERTLFEGKIFK